MNDGEGCVVDTRRMFHAASAASNQPARRPTRGSGLGGVIDTFSVGALTLTVGVDLDVAQLAKSKKPRASEHLRIKSRVTGDSGGVWDRERLFTARTRTSYGRRFPRRNVGGLALDAAPQLPPIRRRSRLSLRGGA